MNNYFRKEFLLSVTTSVLLSLLLFAGYILFLTSDDAPTAYDETKLPSNYIVASKLVGTSSDNPMFDFTKASLTAVPAVVHIKTTFAKQIVKSKSSPFGRGGRDPFFDDFFDGFFGFGPQVIPEQQASGSGVVVSSDGYIVTNNHVIHDERNNVAKEITVTLSNGQTYDAELIGNDPSSDLAVIKVKATKLPYLVYGNSDYVGLGQWVLAVGYPLNLDATVTAGIVSAKSRTLGINYRQQKSQQGAIRASAIESFIQTDAAVNKGNSGGALVNLQGEFIGVNSAIATPTGYYSGYSFAIPSNIVKKITGDIIKYGKAQRGYLGIEFPNDLIPEAKLKEQGMYVEEGIYISDVIEDGAAAKAGLQKGDIILKIDDKDVNKGSSLSAKLAMYKPGDKVKITYKRDNRSKTAYVILKNNLGTYDVTKKKNIEEEIGAEMKEISDAERDKYEIRRGGVQVKKINKNGLLSKTRMDEGFIIVSISGRIVETPKDVYKLLEENRGLTLKLEGFYPSSEGLYSYPIKVE